MKPLKIGILGLGTVGGGLLEIAMGNGPLSKMVEIIGVSARNKARKRPMDISHIAWFDDPIELAKHEEIDVIVELMGGADGPAKAAVEAALKAKKHVVTANKALLSAHGPSLAKIASENNVEILYEAAVAGGIPIVKALREGLAANEVKAIKGVMNGTSNFILTEMAKTGRAFGDVLKEAQMLGLAEADPTLDINGGDAGHKLALLCAIAFNGVPLFGEIELEGIERVEPVDLESAKFLGFAVKLIASASVENNQLAQSVRPSLVSLSNPLAQLDGALNAVLIEAKPVGTLTFIGSGAGAGPTASAVAADLVDLYYGAIRPVFAGSNINRDKIEIAPKKSLNSKFYVRFNVADRPGVIAKISDTLARHQVSIESFLQKPPSNKDNVGIVLTTQKSNETVLIEALNELSNFDEFVEKPFIMPIID
ncbi:MAG: homoserine dehydrogenase [Caulobacterales bacterium]|nr:homoserine dehydrogenase [Caulobacterales bacterium]